MDDIQATFVTQTETAAGQHQFGLKICALQVVSVFAVERSDVAVGELASANVAAAVVVAVTVVSAAEAVVVVAAAVVATVESDPVEVVGVVAFLNIAVVVKICYQIVILADSIGLGFDYFVV